MSQIVNRIGAVGEAEIDNRRGLRIFACIAPEQIRRVQVVVRPQRRERWQQRPKLRMKRRQQFKRLFAAGSHAACSVNAGRAAR